jgi:outer membrane PBP1 activator LpoA protein
MSRLTVFCLSLALLLAGCKPSAPSPEIFKPQTEALEKAKGIEKQLQQSRDRARAAEDEQQK